MKSNQPVTSREYKLMLNTDRFKDRNQGAKTFFDLVEFLVKKEGGIVDKQDKEERRQTSYLDTPQFALRQNGFSLRLREEGAARFKINLKYRGADRYVSAAQDLSSPSSPKGEEIKFEEDILPPFTSKFSHSNSVDAAEIPQLPTMKEVTALFPGLAVFNIDEDTPVKTANDFKALEVVRKLCKFKFGETDPVKASLSFWYLTAETDWPLVTEFSFDYDNQKKLEEFPIETVKGAGRLFVALQNQAGWLDASGSTKTAFALDAL